MTDRRTLTYIEIDIPFCTRTYGVAPCTASIPTTGDIKCFNSRVTCQDIANYNASDVTLRFAVDADYLPADIDCIPSILEISFTPSTISLGENLGGRATLSVTFKDEPHSDTGDGYDKYRSERDYDPYSQGSYWGKFRARQPYLRGVALRWITGLVGDDIADMQTRHFIVDSFDGPRPDGKFTINAKDVLKLADGDRAQCPVLSNGFLSADITAGATTATLLPAGIGNAEYPASGLINIGGNEVVSFTRSGNTLTIARGVIGSTASAHKAQDRCQLVQSFVAADAAYIIKTLLKDFAGVDDTFMSYVEEWLPETAANLGVLYTAYICEPTSVATLISELIEQAALAMWWDDLNQKIRLQVLRGVVTGNATFTPENFIEGSLGLREQPDKRLSQVQVYFGIKDYTKPLSNLDNFRSTSLIIDDDAETAYGSAAIKVIRSRWIPEAGRSIADRLGALQIARFRDPPRRLTFQLMQHANTDVELGLGYRLEAYCVQDATGAQDDIALQVTRVNPTLPNFAVEAEEMLFTVPDADLADRQVIFGADSRNVNLRTAHDSIYPTPVSGDVVTCTIYSGVTIGSSSPLVPAFDVGSWPSGVIVNVVVQGTIEGAGGLGGLGGTAGNGFPAGDGGIALYTRYSINLDLSSGGYLWGGGGGGGGGASFNPVSGGGGGGGGAGDTYGLGALGGTGSSYNGSGAGNGTRTTAGAGGPGGLAAGTGGDGGGPGLPGSDGGNSRYLGFLGGAGGDAGAAIDGVSHCTITGTGDRRGGQIN